MISDEQVEFRETWRRISVDAYQVTIERRDAQLRWEEIVRDVRPGPPPYAALAKPSVGL